jgi:hypothetical protein
VVAILGARQVGKTTLARQLVESMPGWAEVFDLEDPQDLARLSEPMLALKELRGLVVIDEIQRKPDLFEVLRVLVDRPRAPARFLVLGSASPELLRQTSETLAGRIAFYELNGFALDEVGARQMEKLWMRGCFPRSFLARTNPESAQWRRDFIRTFLERDMPQLGVTISSATLRRFWSMLAHCHGQVWNASDFARSLGVADTTVRRYLDLLNDTFVVRLLLPFHQNIKKRQVKAPKVYLSDSGILHSLLGLESRRDVQAHPKMGASWEGFALAQVVNRLGARPEECFFWATHAGAELDLLVTRGNRRLGFEFKYTDSPSSTRSMRIAMEDLKLDKLTVIHAGEHTFPLDKTIEAMAISRILDDLKPLT